MSKKIKQITKLCSTCKKSKYERHPNIPKLGETPLPKYPGHTIHIDIFSTERHLVLTAIDKFTKFAITKNIASKAIEDIRRPLREILFQFGVPECVVIDNEKSFNSESILFMLKEELNINVFTTPPYKSSVNGQVERFHSTLTEIMRCLKPKAINKNFEELLENATNEYNHTFHSTTKKRPVDLFFGRTVHFGPEEYEKTRLSNVEKLKQKQQKDLNYHNRKRHEIKNYNLGDKIYVRRNKRIGSKLTERYCKEIVEENYTTTVKTKSGKIVHKEHIRN